MKVLITGGHGFIGAWVAKQLVDGGAEVIAYDVETRPWRLEMIAPEALAKITTVAGTIEDTAKVKKLVKDQGVTHIVHLAAVLMPFCQTNPVLGGMINVIGTLNVFEAARDAGRPVRVVYASSSAVWGPGEAYEDRPLTEEDPIKPSTFYGIYKQANEECAQVFYTTDGINSMGIRPWTVYGPGRDKGLTGDPTLAMRAVVMGERFTIRLSGHMDMQYAADVADALARCTLSQVEGAHVFNLAGEIVTIEQIIQVMEELRPGAAKLITHTGPKVPVAFKMDDSHIQKLVPGILKTSLREGTRQTLEVFERAKAAGKLM